MGTMFLAEEEKGMSARFTRTMIGVAILLAVVSQVAHAETDGDFYRWAVGWDDGVGVRYLVSPHWGLGLRVSPRLSDYSNDVLIAPDQDDPYTPGPSRESDNHSFDVGIMVFRTVEIGRGFGFGPFAKLGYYRSDGKITDNSSGAESVNETNENRYTLEIGVRPTYSFSKRFVLETRLGVGLLVINRDNDSDSPGGLLRRTEYRQTDLYAFGKDLGPGAVVQFMVYF
jgi:hypothetical protein